MWHGYTQLSWKESEMSARSWQGRYTQGKNVRALEDDCDLDGKWEENVFQVGEKHGKKQLDFTRSFFW